MAPRPWQKAIPEFVSSSAPSPILSLTWSRKERDLETLFDLCVEDQNVLSEFIDLFISVPLYIFDCNSFSLVQRVKLEILQIRRQYLSPQSNVLFRFGQLINLRLSVNGSFLISILVKNTLNIPSFTQLFELYSFWILW